MKPIHPPKRAFALLICLVAFCLLGPTHPLKANGQDQATVTVGALLDLSGPDSSIGVSAYKAIRLAAEEINRQGGIKGRKLNIAVFDTKGQKDLLLLGAGKLQHEYGALALLGPTAEANVTLFRRYGETNKIPVVLIQGLEPILKFAGVKTAWTFSTTLNFDAELKALFKYFKMKRYETLGGLLDNTASVRKVGLWIRGYAPEYGMKITCLGSFNPNQDDFAMKLRYLSRCAPDIAIIWTGWPASSLVQTNLRGIDVPIALSHQIFFKDPQTLALPVGSLIYIVVPPILFSHAVPSTCLSYFVTKRFVDLWGHDFQTMPPVQQLAAGQAWDGICLLRRAMSATQRLSPKEIRYSLERNIAPFVGVTGVFSPNKRDHSGLSPNSLLLLRCMGSRWSLVKRH